MDEFITTESALVGLLVIVSIVAILVRRIKLPYTVALVVAGLVLAIRGPLEFELTPELVLALFVPPLVFEAAIHLQLRDLRADFGSILTLAAPGIVVSTAIVGTVLVYTGILSWPVALLFGALISATDPVAVVATFRAVGAPKRLTTLVEGESLFNDGTAIVVFHIMLAWVVEGTLSPVEGLINFVVVSLGGIFVGVLLGYAIARVIASIDDYLIEITLTTILAFGSYLLAEQLHVSGVLAVVAAGLLSGAVGSKGMSPTTRIVLTNFWEYIAFLANSLVFILIGLNVHFDEMIQFLQPALIAVLAVLAARMLTVYLLGSIIRYFKPDLPFRYLHVMVWGGLRGAVSLALALSLPLGVADRRQLLAMTFAVVLFTLLAQATTIPTLLIRLGFTRKATPVALYERLQGELLAVRAASRHLDRLYYEGSLIPPVREIVKDELDTREQELVTGVKDLLVEQPELQARMVSVTRREVLRAERAALDTLLRDELLDETALRELQATLDKRIAALEFEEIEGPSLQELPAVTREAKI